MSLIDFNRDFEKDLVWREEQDSHFRATGIYYPSELVFPCSRNHVLRYLYPDRKVIDGATLQKFQQGLLLEEWFIRRLKESRYWDVLGTQESVGHITEDGIIFMGRRDVRAYSYYLQKTFSIEVKKAGLNWKFYPKAENMLQANFYLNPKLSGLLVYINPFLETRAFPHPFNKKDFEEIINRGCNYHFALKNKLLPKPEPWHWNHRVCDYCLFSEECKSG